MRLKRERESERDKSKYLEESGGLALEREVEEEG